MSWRPEGWENPIKEPFFVPRFWMGQEHYYIDPGAASALFEAGADAMLEALRQRAGNIGTILDTLDPLTGKLVFIPDDEEAMK